MSDTPRHQLPLSVITPFSYRAHEFVVHAGVAPVVDSLSELSDDLVAGVTARRFRSVIALGSPRSGKTHLGIYIADVMARNGFLPVFRSGTDVRGIERIESAGQRVMVVLDEAEQLLVASDSAVGTFVSMYEQVRQGNGVLLCLTREPLRSSNPHLESRFASSLGFLVQDPERSEIAAVLQSMARQRGIKLNDRNASFVEKRIGNHIPTLEQYLDRVVHLAETRGESVGLELLKDAV